MKKLTLLFAAMLFTLGVAAQQHRNLSSLYESKFSNARFDKAIEAQPRVAKKLSKAPSFNLLDAAKMTSPKRDKAASSRQVIETYLNSRIYDKDWMTFPHRYMEDRYMVMEEDTIMFPIMQYEDGSGIFARAIRQGKSNLFDNLDVDSFIMPRRFVMTLSSSKKDIYISGLELGFDEKAEQYTFALKDSITVYYFNDNGEVFIPDVLGLVSEDLSVMQYVMAEMDFEPQANYEDATYDALVEFSYPDYDVTLAGDTIDVQKTMKKLTKCIYYSNVVYVKDLSFVSAYNELGTWLRLDVSETDPSVFNLENMQRIATYGTTGVYNYAVTSQGGLGDAVSFYVSDPEDGTLLFEQFGANTYYELMYYNGSLVPFFYTDQLRFAIYGKDAVITQPITLDDSGYATFGNETTSFQAPDGLKVLYVTGMNSNGLVYAEAPQNVIPAGEGVLLKAVNGKGGEYQLAVVDTTVVKVKYGANALYPSSFVDYVYDYYAEKQQDMNDSFLFYKFTYNNNTREKLGWFWGAKNGNYFYNDRGKAMLMLKKSSGQNISAFLINDAEINGISDVAAKHANENVFFNMQGVRVAKPQQKGLYIVNNKKVFIK